LSRSPYLTLDYIYYWAPPILWTIAILALSGDLGSSQRTLSLVRGLLSWIPHITPAQVEIIHGYLRKAGHFLGYAFLYFLWFRAFQGHLRYGLKKSFLLALGLSLGLALADEGHQSIFVSRSGSLWDVALDMSGVFLAALICATLWTLQRPKARRVLTEGLRE